MASISVEVLSHLVRRGVQESSSYFSTKTLHARSQNGTFNGFAVFTVMALMIFTFFIVASVEYTVGNLMVKLAMIEAPTHLRVIETQPPAYTEKPAVSDEKEPLMDEPDLEVVTIKQKPITSSVRDTIKHLHRVGGFRARWRGLREAIVYQVLGQILGHVFTTIFFPDATPFVAHGIGFSVATFVLCRFRMVWTHAMVAAPSDKPWYRRYCARKGTRVLLLPSLFYILSVHTALLSPFVVWYGLGAFNYASPQEFGMLRGSELAMAVCSLLAGPSVGLLVVFFWTIPTSIALTRIEACLLPEDDQTIVSFDRVAIIGDIDLTVRGAPGKLFSSAWKSVSFSTRARVISLYAKMVLFQASVVFVNLLIALAVLYVTDPDQILILLWAMHG